MRKKRAATLLAVLTRALSLSATSLVVVSLGRWSCHTLSLKTHTERLGVVRMMTLRVTESEVGDEAGLRLRRGRKAVATRNEGR